MKQNQKILITGCSYSASNYQSGWKDDTIKFHYSKILERELDCTIDNKAIGGCSNREICLRTIENCLQNQYDLCLVQWTTLHRLWLYEANNNIDQETQILPRVCGYLTDDFVPAHLSKLVASTYLNDFVALKHWLQEQVLLQSFFRNQRQRYIFVRAGSNFVADLEHLKAQWPKNTIPELDIPKNIKKMLCFDQNPDDLLHSKISTLMSGYLAIDRSHCIGYNTNDRLYGAGTEIEKDYADDGIHPGRSINQFVADQILHYLSKDVDV